MTEGLIRTFIAIELPPELKTRLASLRDALPIPSQAVKWVNPESMHLTIKFLGDTPLSQIPNIIKGLEKAAQVCYAFTLSTTRIGAFPSLSSPKVIWLGLDGEIEKLNTLFAEVEKNISGLGFPAEKRDFAPHLTLGRLKEGAAKSDLQTAAETLKTAPPVPKTSFRALNICLFKSQLLPAGPVYTRLAQISLA
ncbi:MAG: 2'-5' RNA ligase family protein [Dehalococcoides mccartyi]|uniref:RNA 2',3'-cyclic phosphodiesterase n=1 Tax=Dehalococcoides mccartyi TaxID=61435 RepID=UPI00098F660F|nr:RNA 2',3'-cyclic phosphodiesterase [Dehalococcoides mccartyi]AQU03656.1 2'-5' RNA ligase [Dehalococcoides mccartyi]AQU04956.1 2'-5' RNA ligase [Dehalococcoides mccartyi]MCF7635635.1 2'-5' RNA ligase family protein [Dehalococcoides mccartyi]MEA2120960.1 RNA 2',3'-cyclic phosphodiesterase [Dehalococcoides mccartyi]MEA2122718.1 RNA 2',3'-cyclic phosphodiesterase [Dehalococcoides mccartyi]